MTLFRTIFAFVCLMTTAVLAQRLSVSPAPCDLGEFPSWESPKVMFAIKNTLERPVNLLRVRSSCSCLVADFQPCTLEAGQKTAVTVTIPANSVSGDFSKTVFLETDDRRLTSSRHRQAHGCHLEGFRNEAPLPMSVQLPHAYSVQRCLIAYFSIKLWQSDATPKTHVILIGWFFLTGTIQFLNW
jgi:hypothetical protein